MHGKFLPIAFAVTMFAAGPSLAEMVTYKSELKGAAEVPPNTSKGSGTVDATYDTAANKLSWTVTYSGLTGAATAAHFHGPAAAGANAPPIVPLSGTMQSPLKGEATLTPAQATELREGHVYFNVHTAEHPGGELRGQLTAK